MSHFNHLGRPGKVGGSLPKNNLNRLFLILKGGSGSGNFDHAGIPGHRGGSTPSGSKTVVGSVAGNQMYRIEGPRIPEDLVNKPAFMLISPKGNLYIAKNETTSSPRHEMMVDQLHDPMNYDFYARAEVQKGEKGSLNLVFGTYGAGIGTGFIDEKHDKIADKKFGRLAAQMLNSGYNPQMRVKWYTSDGIWVDSTLEDWA